MLLKVIIYLNQTEFYKLSDLHLPNNNSKFLLTKAITILVNTIKPFYKLSFKLIILSKILSLVGFSII